MATSLSTRPSELLGITDVYAAFCLDQVVWYAGSTIDHDLSETVDSAVNGKNKHKSKADMAQKKVFRKYFGQEDAAVPQYADPSAMISP